MMFDVILLMAGNAQRTNLGYNKVFYQILEKPIYLYSLDVFLEMEECARIIIVAKKEEISLLRSVENNRVLVVEGGPLRQDSVYYGLKHTTQPLILIHDAARPNIKKEDIIKLVAEMKDADGAALGFPVQDTIKEITEEQLQTLERSKLWTIQTPQAIKRDILMSCLSKAQIDQFTAYDDLQLLEKYGYSHLKIVTGSKYNLKVTTMEDMKLAEWMIGEGL